MTYTKTKPSAPGWYWMKYRGNNWIDEVAMADGVLVVFNDDRCTDEYTRVDELLVDEFAGPIPEPGAHFIDRLKAAGVELTPDQEAALRAEWPADAAVSVSAYSGQWMIHGVKRKQ